MRLPGAPRENDMKTIKRMPSTDGTLQRLLRVLGAACTLLSLCGCSAVGPDYVKPETEAPFSLVLRTPGRSDQLAIDPQTLAQWWSTLEDPALSSFMERAVRGNLDLKNARARVREARVLRGINRARLFPIIDATGSATKSRNSENSGDGARMNGCEKRLTA